MDHMDQGQSPVLDALAEYHRLGRYGFTPPGHKQGRGADPRVREVLGNDPFRDDVLASAGLDDRSSSGKVLERSQELMAAVGAEHAFFSTCGSSLSVKSAMLAVAGIEGDMLIGRDAHKSVIAGVILAGFTPRWISPQWDTDLHLAHPPSVDSVEKALSRWPNAAGVLITSPTPYGTCADLAGITKACHAHGVPLIVDEAWGAHLPFHDDLPTWAMDAGADVCVVSIHKMGAGFEQGSVFHLQGGLIDPRHLKACADLLSTTSANVMLYAAIDGWRRQMVEQGDQLLGAALELARSTRRSLGAIDGISVMEQEFLGREASHDLDPLQMVLDLSALGISGYQASDWLREQHCIDVGLSDHRRIAAQLSHADDDDTAERLIHAVTALSAAAADFPRPPSIDLPDPEHLQLETVQLPRDAFFGPAEHVPVAEAAGRVAAEQITPYPPGIPAVLPGDRLNQEVIHYLRSGLAAGMVIPDAADASLETVRVCSP
jgi:arginine decarboxylase